MIYCQINYTIDPYKLAEFERYAATWPNIIARCGGELTGYFVCAEGRNNYACALIGFADLGSYEQYRRNLLADEDARANIAYMRETRSVLAEERLFLRRC